MFAMQSTDIKPVAIISNGFSVWRIQWQRCYTLPYYAVLCYIKLYFAIQSYAMLCYAKRKFNLFVLMSNLLLDGCLRWLVNEIGEWESGLSIPESEWNE